MNILYLTPQPNYEVQYSEKADYMSDMLFHGLRSIYQDKVVDIFKKEHLYKGYPHISKLWGKGFSYTDTLDDIDIDRSDYVDKLEKNFYDLVVVSIHHTVQYNYFIIENFIRDLVNMTKSKVAIVDGHDLPNYSYNLLKYTNLLFKREIHDDNDKNVIPINFGIPETKLVDKTPEKVRHFANLLPCNLDSKFRNTYTFTVESDYYNHYQESKFAFTCKKGGWDCMRHYEILANRCVPIFTDIENCPKNTLTNLPKDLLIRAKNIPGLKLNSRHQTIFNMNEIDLDFQLLSSFDENLYTEISEELFEITKNKLTTSKMAEDFIKKCFM